MYDPRPCGWGKAHEVTVRRTRARYTCTAGTARGTFGTFPSPVLDQELLCMESHAFPRLCLVMPVCDEAAYLPEVLASIAAQAYDRRRFRLVAVDNGSTDDSSAVLARWFAASGVAGTIVRTEVRSIPHALNLGVAAAEPDECIVRLDAHTTYGPSYLTTIGGAFTRLPDDVWCVGGKPLPQAASSYAHRIVAAFMTSPLGAGGAEFRRAREERPVHAVYLGAWRPGVVQRLGGFNERWRANEDGELVERLAAAGGKTWFVPAPSSYLIKRGLLSTIRQWSRYGFWRAQTLKCHPRATRLRHLAPPFALAAAVVLAFSPVRIALVPLVAAYAAAIIAARAPGEAPVTTLGSLAFFPLGHAAFGAGILTGFLRRLPGAPCAARTGGVPGVERLEELRVRRTGESRTQLTADDSFERSVENRSLGDDLGAAIRG